MLLSGAKVIQSILEENIYKCQSLQLIVYYDVLFYLNLCLSQEKINLIMYYKKISNLLFKVYLSL